jgi:uncharacterized protein
MKKIFKRYYEKVKNHFLEVLKVKTSPHEIALGFAVGTFVSVLPTPGLSILLAFLITLIFPKLSKLSLVGALIVWNPLVSSPLYYLSYRIGAWIIGGEPVIRFDVVFWDHVYNLTRRYLVGGTIVAFFSAIASYFVVRILAKIYYSRKE